MPHGQAGMVLSEVALGNTRIWQYELNGLRSNYECESAEEALEELQRKLNSREYYMPADCPTDAPLLILFHGAGREGESEISRWEPIAEKEKILLLAPTSPNTQLWWGGSTQDHQKLSSELNNVLQSWPVNLRRIYVAGHSVGGRYALQIGFENPNIIAAVASHSPYMPVGFVHRVFPLEARRVPICVWVGDRDVNRHDGECLQRGLKDLRDISIDLKVLDDHEHRDYHKRPGLPHEMWGFLKNHSL